MSDIDEKAPGTSRGRRDFLKLMTALPVTGLIAAAPGIMVGADVSSDNPASGQAKQEYDPQQLNPYRLSEVPPLEDLIPDKKFIWADLRAFDNTAPGFGAEEYLRNVSFKPNAIFLLLSNPDFVFLHDTVSVDRPLEDRFVVYGGKTVAAQKWTRFQLKGFLSAMHRAGVKVLASMFMATAGATAEDTPDAHDWFEKHPEVLVSNKDGGIVRCVNPMKRLNTGQLFEDVFSEHLTKCLSAFGFDGYHAADGSTHLPLPLSQADFSDDMVGQFLEHSNLELPPAYRKQCGSDVDAMKARAGWILDEKRAAWTAFYRYRWGAYWRKIAKALKEKKMMVVANQSCAMPPYEAIYRYGFDYKVLEEIGIDALVVETAGGPVQMGCCTPEVGKLQSMWIDDATAMVACVKAYVPSLPLVFLLDVQDEKEQWDTLRLDPPLLEKEIFSYGLTFYANGQGTLSRCLDGFLVCLGVGLSKAEWARVGKSLVGAFANPDVAGIKSEGVTAIWSDRVMENQLARHLSKGAGWPQPPLHSYIRNLSHEGASLRTIVRLESIQKISNPLLLVGADALDQADLSRLSTWLSDGSSPRRLIIIGEEPTSLKNNLLLIRDYPEYGKTECAVLTNRHSEDTHLREDLGDKLKIYEPVLSGAPLILAIDKTSGTFFPVTHTEPASFVYPLPYLPIYNDFVSKVATTIQCIENSGATSDQGSVFSLMDGEHSRFLMILNDKPVYLLCKVSVNKPIAKFKLISFPFPRRPTITGDKTFEIKVPPNGVAVMKIESR